MTIPMVGYSYLINPSKWYHVYKIPTIHLQDMKYGRYTLNTLTKEVSCHKSRSLWHIMKILNFQNFNLCLIYLIFNSALESMGKAYFINIFVKKKNHFHENLLVESCKHFLSVKISQIKLFIYRVDFQEIRFFLFLQRADTSNFTKYM
jgi:hypothetical protein